MVLSGIWELVLGVTWTTLFMWSLTIRQAILMSSDSGGAAQEGKAQSCKASWDPGSTLVYLYFHCTLLAKKSQSQFRFKIQYRNKLLWGGAAKKCVAILNLPKFSLVDQLCPTLCDTMDWSTLGFPVHHQLPEPVQTHVHRVSDAIQPSHPLLSPSPPTFNLSQHQDLFQWDSSSKQVAKILQFHPQHQSFQWIFRPDFL